MLMRCPHCGAAVEPARDAAGQPLCPLCRNTGRQAAPPAPPPPPPPPPAASAPPGWTAAGPVAGAGWAAGAPAAAPAWPSAAPPPPTPGKAVAALVVGIAAIVVFPLAIFLAPAAIVLGIMALNQIKRMPPGTPGKGMAITGIALGGVAILVGVIVLAAVVFVLVSNLGDSGSWAFDVDDTGPGGVLTVTDYPGFPDWSEYYLDGDASCRLPSGPVDFDDQIVCTTDGEVSLVDATTNEVLYSATV